MPLDTSVKYIHSEMPGAPALTAAPGTLLAVLNACLVTGFGTQSVDSITVAAGIATVVRAAGHPYEKHQVVLIAGATPSGLNGQKRILSTTTTSYTFEAPGVADQVASGSITQSIAPLGWVKPFADAGNIGVYKSADPTSTGCILRVDDTNSNTARARGYETMTSLSVGSTRFPEDDRASGGYYWAKSATGGYTQRWAVIGDSKFFYFVVSHYYGYTDMYSICASFGDYIYARQGFNPFACAITGHINTWSGTSPANSFEFVYSTESVYDYVSIPRNSSGLAGPFYLRRLASSHPFGMSSGWYSGGGTGAFPNSVDGSLYLNPCSLGGGNSHFGMFPGYLACPQSIGSSFFPSKSSLEDVSFPSLIGANLQGRVIKAFRASTSVVGFFDITGPWRA